MTIYRTKKQRMIVETILKAADEGRFLNHKELHAVLPYTCSYGSLRTSLKFLVGHGVLEKERTGLSVVLKPTARAYSLFRTMIS